MMVSGSVPTRHSESFIDASGPLLVLHEDDRARSQHLLPSPVGEANEIMADKTPGINAEIESVSSVGIMLESTAMDRTSESNGSSLEEGTHKNFISSATKSNDSTSIRTEQTLQKSPFAAVAVDLKPTCNTTSKNNADGVQMMYDSVISLPANENNTNINPSDDSTNKFQPIQLYSDDGVSVSPVGSSHHSFHQPQANLSHSNLSNEMRCSPDPLSHVSAAHEILNSFIALNPTPDRLDTSSPRDNERNTASPIMGGDGAPLLTLEERIDDDQRPSSVTSNSSRPLSSEFVRKPSQHAMPTMNYSDLENLNTNASENSMSSSTKKSCSSTNNSLTGSYDKKKLNERLRQRLAERNQRTRERLSSGKMIVNTQPESHQKTHERSGSDSQYLANKAAFDAFVAKYGISPTGNAFPDTVSFDEDNQNETLFSRRSFRKSSSEAGTTPTHVAPRPTLRQVPPPHGIGILQPDGVVFDDTLLLRLARQTRTTSEVGSNTEQRYNSVKIHVYDLLQKDSLVEMPYFNCNFPIGQCFKVINNAANCLGTGVYHVGVEVNGIEYAFGANNILGMTGIFTCPPKQSPGYEYRESLDFGDVSTTRSTWIRIPKENALGRSISNALAAINEVELNKHRNTTSTLATSEYIFRQIESFADGNGLIHSMAKEYMGTDYDLLRKNCCTFAHDVCIRLGVKKEDIPSWFHNAAKAGADAEDAIASAEQTVKNMFDCADIEGGPSDLMEGYNHGFEVIADVSGSSKLKVVESLPVYRYVNGRQPLLEENTNSLDGLV